MKRIIFLLISSFLLNSSILPSTELYIKSIYNEKFINYLESFIDKPLNTLVSELINSGNYYYTIKEETDTQGNIIAWEMKFTKNLSIFIYFKKLDRLGFSIISIKYPNIKFDFNHFQNEKISQILIRQNMEEDPVEHYYKWIILPREKEKSNKKIKK